MPGLNDIIQLLRGGALEPQDALEMHFANEEARKAKRQEALGGLMDIGFEGAQQGMSLDSLVPMLQAQATFQGRPNLTNNPKLLGGLDSLYDKSGQSLVAAASTDLDPEDEAEIANQVFNAVANRSSNPGADTSLLGIRQSIIRRLPQEYMAYIPQIDAAISKAYTASQKGLF